MTREERGSFRSERTGPPVGGRPLSTVPVTPRLPALAGPIRLADPVRRRVQSDSAKHNLCLCSAVYRLYTPALYLSPVTRPSSLFLAEKQHAVKFRPCTSSFSPRRGSHSRRSTIPQGHAWTPQSPALTGRQPPLRGGGGALLRHWCPPSVRILTVTDVTLLSAL